MCIWVERAEKNIWKNNDQRFAKFDENYKPTQTVNSADSKNKTQKEKYTKL